MLWGGNKGYGNGFDAQKREGGGACSICVQEYAVIKYAIIKNAFIKDTKVQNLVGM
jgi:hypothetical protein